MGSSISRLTDHSLELGAKKLKFTQTDELAKLCNTEISPCLGTEFILSIEVRDFGLVRSLTQMQTDVNEIL